jgi:hypothetical protein
VRPDLFLVARLAPEALVDDDLEWLADDGFPFVSVDPIDFLMGTEIASIFELYRTTYGRLDPCLNVNMPEALIEYNRWVLVMGKKGTIEAFACFKTTASGVKLGLAATDGGDRGKVALKILLRQGLSVEGVYAEVSGGLEVALIGHVPEVSPKMASSILEKPTTEESDGRHYSRVITNVGPKTKIMVGRPFKPESGG